MPTLVKNGALHDDSWIVLGKGDEFPRAQFDAGELLMLPLEMWLAHADSVAGAPNISVWLDSDEEPAKLCETSGDADDADSSASVFDCNNLPLIAINFPVFSDGRGYSYARQLREHYGYTGELRAIGDILRDQLFFYKRCGFNSYALRDDRDASDALASLQDFSQSYQAANDNSVPVFHRR